MSMIQVYHENNPDICYPFLEVEGTRYPCTFDEGIIRGVREMTLRDDDVMLCGFVRSGTHWCFEIINMLLRQTTETVPWPKDYLHIEKMGEKDLAKLPSPRVMNGHMRFHQLPKGVISQGIKVIYLMRDPRDVMSSWYELMAKYHQNRNPGRRFWPFCDYVPLLLRNQFAWGSWFDHVIEWEKGMLKYPNHPFLVVHYEDLIQNTADQIKKIADFLDVKVDEQFCGRVAEKCRLDTMKRDKREVTEKLDGQIIHYFQGKSGAWKRYFTVEMSESFNQLYEDKMRCSRFYERYKHTN